MMIQLDLLTKCVTGITKAVNAIVTSENLSQEVVAYDKYVQYLCQMGSYHPNFKGKMSIKVGIKDESREIVV